MALSVTTQEQQGACGSAEEIPHPTGCPMAPPPHLLPPPGSTHPATVHLALGLHRARFEADIITSHSLTWHKPRHFARPQCDLSSPPQATGAPGEKRGYLSVPLIDSLTSSRSPHRDQAQKVLCLVKRLLSICHVPAAVLRASVVPHSPRGMHCHCLAIYSYLSFRFGPFPETLTFS